MGLSERVGWLMLGIAIGFVLGYIVRTLHDLGDEVGEIKHEVVDIKEELDEVDEIVKHGVLPEKDEPQTPEPKPPFKDERGFISLPRWKNIALFIVVMLTVYAAFASQAASNKTRNIQGVLAQYTFCNRIYLGKGFDVLNARADYAEQQVAANVEVQKSQARFLKFIIGKPPKPPEVRRASTQEYLDDLNSFIAISNEATRQRKVNPLPTSNELQECYDRSKR